MTHRTQVRMNRVAGINLVLWMMAAGIVTFDAPVSESAKVVVWIGVAFAALAQHWAYHADKAGGEVLP